MAEKTLKEIAERLKGELAGDGAAKVSGIKDITGAGSGDLAFILHPKFAGLLQKTKAACVVAPAGVEKAGPAMIYVKNTAVAFREAVDLLGVGRIPHPAGVHQTAVIASGASVGKNAGIGAYCVIEEGASIGDNTVLYPFTYVGRGAAIGKDSIIYSNVSIREGISIGDRVIIHAGSVIGSDGFGYDSATGVHLKIPQIGTVEIGDDVEIGACVTVDRAKFARTKIGRGTKIDNLVQIAHNVEIGENCIIVAQCGISGSTTVGRFVVMGGQVGIVDHVKIGDGAMIAAQSGISKSVHPGKIMMGTPATEIVEMRKMIALHRKLPELYERIKNLEKALGEKKDNAKNDS